MTRIKLTNAQQFAIRFIYDHQLEKDAPHDVLISAVPSWAMPGATLIALVKRKLIFWPPDSESIFIRLSPEAFKLAPELPSTVFNTGVWMKREKFAWFDLTP